MRILSKSFVVDLALAGLVFGATAFAPDMAHAQASGADSFLQDIFCKAINLVQGSTAQALATIAIIIVGIGALLGRVNWGMAALIVAGIALIFGAGQIASFIGGGTECAA